VSKDNAIVDSFDLAFPENINISSLRLQSDSIGELKDLNGKVIGPFQVQTLKLSLRIRKPGSYEIASIISYVDGVGEHKTSNCSKKTVTASFEAETNSERIATGYNALDDLLMGGIPRNYAVVLVSPPCSEKDILINSFLESGVRFQEPTFCITTDIENAGSLIKEKNPNNAVFLCTQRTNDNAITPNLVRIRGIENLTEIDIQIAKAIRLLDKQYSGPKRAYIEILSDVLLQHHAIVTRKWLSGLIQDLKSNGFTVMVAVNPKMHPSEELQATLGLFEGELVLSEQDGPVEKRFALKVRRLSNQRYLDNTIYLNKQKSEIVK
jgi:hypothetical protein